MSAPRVLRFTALGGLVLVAIVAPRTATMPALLLMLASGVAVPLGLALALDPAATPPPGHVSPALLRVLALLAPLGALGGVVGWVFPPGRPEAIAGAVLHALVCACAGVLALTRILPMLRRRALGPLPELAIDVGLLFLPAAAAWLLASRAAMPLIGFQEPVVTFTAAHFHFAGFAAPMILGCTGRLLAGTQPRLYRVATIAVCAGVPLTAFGIATNHTIEQIAAVTVALGMLAAAVILVAYASRRTGSRLAALLFVVSGTTLILTMTLAATFALTSSAGRGSSLQGFVPLQTMIDWHGAANAIGFSLAGLAALTLQQLRSTGPTPEPRLPRSPD